MSGNPICSISAYEGWKDGHISLSICLTDGRSASQQVPEEVVSDLACWLNTRLDRSTESFRPFLVGLGWVWDKYFTKVEVEDEFECPF